MESVKIVLSNSSAYLWDIRVLLKQSLILFPIYLKASQAALWDKYWEYHSSERGQFVQRSSVPSILERFCIVMLLPGRQPSRNWYSSVAIVLPQKCKVSNKYARVRGKRRNLAGLLLSLPWCYTSHPFIQIPISSHASQSLSVSKFFTKDIPIWSPLQNIN